MARPVIALLTDFGLADSYVGAMKGVMLGVCPDAALVDITHDITPHDVLEGALELAACHEAFPAGTIFLAIVDPGVGSARRPLAAECGGRRFVAPDNGILTAVFRDAAPGRIVELADPRYARPVISRTFEGRDRFAPAAAWLARGIDLAALGPPIEQIVRLPIPIAEVAAGLIRGEVLRVDRFGNVVTNIDRGTWRRAAAPEAPEILVAGRRVSGLVQTYSAIPAGEVAALFGSRECLELSAREDSAWAQLSVRRGDPVVVAWGAKGR